MAGKLTEDALARKDLIDVVRTVVGLESRIERRRRLNEVEAEVLAEYDDRVSRGLPYKPNIAALLQGELQ